MPERPIRQIIRERRVVKAADTATVAEAARLMKEHHVGAVVVVHRERLVGIVTERDIVTRVVTEGRDPAHTRLSDVMTREPRTMPPDKPFGHALILMHEHAFRHVPIVERGHVVGLVSMRDALPPELDGLQHDLADREHIAEILG